MFFLGITKSCFVIGTYADAVFYSFTHNSVMNQHEAAKQTPSVLWKTWHDHDWKNSHNIFPISLLHCKLQTPNTT